MPPEDNLAIVTGTSAGIGAALARSLLLDGWQVVGLARREAPLTHAAYRHIEADLGNLPALKALAEARIAPLLRDPRWKRVGLVNNAAMLGDASGLENSHPLALARVFAVNSVAPTYLMGLTVRETRFDLRLRIVNVSSGLATRAYPGSGEYSASKAALRMAGMTLAEELRSDVRPGGPRPNAAILSYEPGVVDTEMQTRARSAPAEGAPWKELFVDFARSGRLQPAEAVVADVVGFLAGDSPEPFTERRFGAP